MSFVVYPVYRNIGCFELVYTRYSAMKAVEMMLCCKCSVIVKVVLEA